MKLKSLAFQKTAQAAEQSRVRQSFAAFAKTAGLAKKTGGAEKTAAHGETVAQMRDSFLKKATSAIMSQVAADMYQDPLLARLIDAGDMKTASRLAEGRIADAETLGKLASLGVAEVQRLAEDGLKSRLSEKLASAPTPKKRSPLYRF